MAVKRSVGFFEGLRYQGGGPMIAWMLHRVTGLGILVFVGLHVIASFFMQQTGSDWAISLNTIYESWIFQIFVVFCVLFHVINGLRIAILDVWPQFLPYQHEALWLQYAVFFIVYGLTLFLLVQNGLAVS